MSYSTSFCLNTFIFDAVGSDNVAHIVLVKDKYIVPNAWWLCDFYKAQYIPFIINDRRIVLEERHNA